MSIFRKWWLIALVMTLAMSLTSCSGSRNRQTYADYGFFACEGALGRFEVYTIATPGQSGRYDLAIIPTALTQQGDIVTITVANKNNMYQEKVSQVVLVNNTEVAGGSLSESDLQSYEFVAITPFQPGVNFIEGGTEFDTFCPLPRIGDGLQ